MNPSSSEVGPEEEFSTESSVVHLSQWNPMLEAYSSKAFNSYFRPAITADYWEKHKTAQDSSGSLESVSPTKGDQEEVTLYICNIPLALNKEGFRSFLSQAAPVRSVKICESKDPERGTTFGFVTVKSPKDAEIIITQFHNYAFGKHNLIVRLALSAQERERKKEAQREEEEFYRKLVEDRERSLDEQSIMDNSRDKQRSSPNEGLPAQKSKTKNDQLCLHCNRPGSKQCGRCKGCYCSAECQQTDWNMHKYECSPAEGPPQRAVPVNNAAPRSTQNSQPSATNKDALLIAVDNMNIEERLYYVNDLKKQEPLDSTFRLLIYVVQDLTMKGQVILESETTALIKLNQEIDSYFKQNSKRLQESNCKEGLLVLLEYEGEVSRASVTKYQRPLQTVEVGFIDFGNTYTCKVSDLLPMPLFAAGLPMQCRSFTLHGMANNIHANVKGQLSEQLSGIVMEKVLHGENRGTDNGIIQLILRDEDSSETSINETMLSLHEELKAKVSNKNKSECRMLLDIPLMPLPKERHFKIMVTHVISPSFFYAQLMDSDLSNVRQLLSIGEAMQHAAEFNTEFKPIIGEACAAFFPEDHAWYRASVLNINGNGTVTVCYFDYGNNADIDPRFVIPLDTELTTLPRQAIKFATSGIKSADPSGEWSTEAITLFKEKTIVEPCDAVGVKLDELCHVQVTVPSEECRLDQLLIQHGYAVACANMEVRGSSPLPSIPNEVQDKKHEIPERFSLEPVHIPKDKECNVVPVHIEDPSHFYVHVAKPEIQLLLEFSSLLHEMPLKPYSKPLIGDSCCALYTDGDWYRAKVISTAEDASVVYFYDYGNTSTVKNTLLKIMPEEVKSLSAQALRVQLHDVEPFPDKISWSDGAREYFKSLIADNISKLEIIRMEGEIVIGNIVTDTKYDVGKELVRMGLAKISSENSTKSVVESNPVAENNSNYKPVAEKREVTEKREDNFVIVAEQKPSKNRTTDVQENGNDSVNECSEEGNRERDAKSQNKQALHSPQAVKTKNEGIENDNRSQVVKNKSGEKQFEDMGFKINYVSENDGNEFNGIERGGGEFRTSDRGNSEFRGNRGGGSGFRGNGRECNRFRGNGRGRNNFGENERGFGPRRGGFIRGRGQNHNHPWMMNNGQKHFGNPMNNPFFPLTMYPFMCPPGYFFPPGNMIPNVPFMNGSGQNWLNMMNGYEQEGHGNNYNRASRPTSEANLEAENIMNGDEGSTEDRSESNGTFRGKGARSPRGYARGGSYSDGCASTNNHSLKRPAKPPQQKNPSDYFSGAEIDFIVTNVENPSHFYIHDEKLKGTERLPLNEYDNATPIESIHEGMVCASKAEAFYYRAVIEHVYSSEKILVRCADTGVNEIVDKSQLKRLTPEDFKRPFNAVKCCLYNAFGKGKHHWSVYAIKYFKHKTQIGNGRMTGVVRGENSTGLMVSIKDPENSGAFLVEDLVKQGFAVYMYQDSKDMQQSF